MTDEQQPPSTWSRLWKVLVGAAAAPGLVLAFVQLDSSITSDPWGVVRALFFLGAVVCGFLLTQRRFRQNSKIRYAIVAPLALCIVAAVFLRPQAQSTSAEATPSDPSSSHRETAPPTTTSQIAVRPVAQWAADVNKVCSQEANRTTPAFGQMRDAGGQIIQLSQQYQINTVEDVSRHSDKLMPPMQQVFSAAATIDLSYAHSFRQIKSVDLPTEDSEKTAAKAWVDRYEQVSDTFHALYETLTNYVTSPDDNARGTYFQIYALDTGPAYNELAPEVVDEGRELGVESCL